MTVHEFDLGRAHIRLEGFQPKSVKNLLSQVEGLRNIDAPLRWEEVFDARIDALLPLPNGTLRGGVFTADCRPVPFAQVKRSQLGVVVGSEMNPTPTSDPKFLDEAIFGGVLFSGYGHIVLETINRLWCASQFDSLPLLFLARPKEVARKRELLEQIAGAYGIDPARIAITSDQTTVRRLIVPEPGLELGLSTNSNHLRFLRSIATASSVPWQGSTYVSRSKLPDTMRKPLDEVVFEDLLISCGLDATWPEQRSFVEQIELFNQYQNYVSFIGSQMHTLLFRDDTRPVKCIYLCNQSPNVNFLQIDSTLPGDRLYTVAAEYEPVFDFGNKCPFTIDYHSASLALESMGHILPKKRPRGMDTDVYIYRWGYALFYHKFFLNRTKAIGAYGIDSADRAFVGSVKELTLRLAASDTAGSVGPILLKAFDEVATWYRATSVPAIVNARQLIVSLSDPGPAKKLSTSDPEPLQR